MIIPPYLVPGDMVALAAPARKISEQEILPAENWLKSEGFNVFYDDRLFAEEHQFAGSDQVRADYFQSLLDNDDVKLIWCVRGVMVLPVSSTDWISPTFVSIRNGYAVIATSPFSTVIFSGI